MGARTAGARGWALEPDVLLNSVAHAPVIGAHSQQNVQFELPSPARAPRRRVRPFDPGCDIAALVTVRRRVVSHETDFAPEGGRLALRSL